MLEWLPSYQSVCFRGLTTAELTCRYPLGEAKMRQCSIHTGQLANDTKDVEWRRLDSGGVPGLSPSIHRLRLGLLGVPSSVPLSVLVECLQANDSKCNLQRAYIKRDSYAFNRYTAEGSKDTMQS